MTAAAPNATTTSKSYKKTAVKEKRLGEKASLSFFKNTLFIFDHAGSSLLLRLFFSFGEQGLFSSCRAQASH